MISTLLVLSASLVTSPVIISEVKATREAGHLRVDVTGDGGIDPESVRTRIDGGSLLIYLGGTRVRADNRAWDLTDGTGEIRAHRHKTEIELVVPLAGNGCAGPVELTGSDTGISALVGCDGTPVASPRAVAEPRKAVEKLPAKATGKTTELRALVELPEEDADVPAVVKTAAPAAVPVMAAVAAPPAAAVGAREPASAQPVAAVPAPAVQAAAAPVLAAPKTSDVLAPAAPAAPAAGSAGALRAVALPALLLAGLAVAAFMFARRRRGFVERHIQILETTTLGPKRSLVVARVGDQMLLLGSSEAGITLLQTRSEAAIASAAAATTTGTAAAISDGPPAVREAAAATAPVAPPIEDFEIETSLPIEEALADIPEPDHGRSLAARSGFRAIEGGLASLFRARAVTADWVNEDKQGGEQSAEQSAESDRFDDLLEDSIEDQELRRKLAAGMSARVR